MTVTTLMWLSVIAVCAGAAVLLGLFIGAKSEADRWRERAIRAETILRQNGLGPAARPQRHAQHSRTTERPAPTVTPSPYVRSRRQRWDV